MSTARPPIVLDRHFFTRLAVNANPEYPPGEQDLNPDDLDSHIHTARLPDQVGAIVCTQTVKLAQSATSPYSLDIECIGFFNKPDGTELTDAELQSSVEIAHQTLYAAVREMVLIMTARMPWGPLTLGLAAIRETPGKAAAETTRSGEAKANPATPRRRRITIRER